MTPYAAAKDYVENVEELALLLGYADYRSYIAEQADAPAAQLQRLRQVVQTL